LEQLQLGNGDSDQLQQRLELEQLSRDELIDEVVALRQINDSRPPSS
jgi:hypothetical protein